MKPLGAALAGTAILACTGVAVADPISDTLFDANVTTGSSKAGTKAKPRANSVTVEVKGANKDGVGQPSNTTAIKVDFPAGWKYNGKQWPAKERCDANKADSEKTASVCPKKSKVGSGASQAKAFGGRIIQNLTVSAHVLKDGNLGFFIEGSVPVGVAQMLRTKVAKGGDIVVTIPPEVQEPLPGAPTGITLLRTGIKGKTKVKKTVKVKGKRVKKTVVLNLLETTACKGGAWNIGVTNVYRDGQLSDSTKVPCKK